MDKTENLYEWLQIWYKSQCDTDWEHEYGIKIETVDNPGWYVTINLLGTECEGKHFSSVRSEIDEDNWYFCIVRDNNFEASCDACSLTTILQIFREWAESAKSPQSFQNKWDHINGR